MSTPITERRQGVLAAFAEALADQILIAVAAKLQPETLRKRLEPLCLRYLEDAHALGCGDVADQGTVAQLLSTHVEKLSVNAAALRDEATKLVKAADWLRELASRKK